MLHVVQDNALTRGLGDTHELARLARVKGCDIRKGDVADLHGRLCGAVGGVVHRHNDGGFCIGDGGVGI